MDYNKKDRNIKMSRYIIVQPKNKKIKKKIKIN